MGRYSSKNNLPYFRSSADAPEYEIKTGMNAGPKYHGGYSDELEPDVFYDFGTITEPVTITRLNPCASDFVPIYIGEFILGPGGSITFPSNVYWAQDTDFEKGYSYQFTIINQVASYIKVNKNIE